MINKFQDAQNKLILQATRVAGNYLLSKYSEAHLTGEPKVELTHTIDPNSSEIVFNGQITCYAAGSLINPIVGVNMSVNSNDIEVESEESIADKVENTLNSQQELEPVKASLDGFKLKDRGDGYLLVSHENLEDANLGIVSQNEYSKSPDRVVLLTSIVKDAMARVANETTISFTGEFKEPVIEKVATEEVLEKEAKHGFCDKCGVSFPHTAYPKDLCDKCEGENTPKKSWLTADMMSEDPEPYADSEQLEETDKYVLWQTPYADHTTYWVSDKEGYELATFNTIEEAKNAMATGEGLQVSEEASLGIKEDMPMAHMSDHLAQAAQLEEQMKNASNEKIKTQAVNALVSMLQSNGYGTAKVREVTASNTGFDVMVTVDADATLKAVNIPVEVKESNIILPKKSLVATLVASGLDLNARLSEEFGKQVLARIEAEEARIQYEQNEANAILAERPTVTKTAGDNGFNTPGYMAPQDQITLQKHLLPSDVEWEKGMVVYADNSYWKLSDMNFDQNSKGTEDASEWHFVRCEAPKDDKDVTNIKI